MRALQALRRRRSMSQQDLADILGVTRAAVSMWETGKTEPDNETLLRIAKILGVTVDELLGGSGNASCHTFPVIGEVAAGYNGGDAKEIYTGETVEIPAAWLRGMQPTEFYVLRASGNSMYPEILDGDLLLVRPVERVDNGRIAIILLAGGSGTVKRIEFSMGKAYVDLIPRNPEYMTKRITGPEIEDIQIQGEVLRIIRDMYWQGGSVHLLIIYISIAIQGGEWMYCRNCGTKLPDGARFCTNCGTGTQEHSSGAGQYAQSGQGAHPGQNAQPYAGFQQQSKNYTVPNQVDNLNWDYLPPYYQQQFAMIRQSNGAYIGKFNWAACLLGAIWLLVKGCWLAGLVWFLVALCTSYLTLGIAPIVIWILVGVRGTYIYYRAYVKNQQVVW